MNEPTLQALLDDGVARGIFPSAQAVVVHAGERRFSIAAGDAGQDTLFDLASLTKVMCTTAAFMVLWGEGQLDPETTLAAIFPKSAAGRAPIRLGDLLYHRSGLPAFVPFFAPVMEAFPLLFSRSCPAPVRVNGRRLVVEAAKGTRRSERRGVYSDVGFILLAEALAKVGGLDLDALYEDKVASRLGAQAHFRRLSKLKSPSAPIAPTGKTRPREPAPGQEHLWDLPARDSFPGEVDDDNAWAMDGVAGHAGLFGTASDVAAFGQTILEEMEGAAKFAPRSLWEMAIQPDAATPGSTRALGFDTPAGESAGGSSAGGYIGRTPPGAIGHLGFTGTSLWIDLARRLVVALCTNRVLLGRGELGIRDFRPLFHDRVVEILGLR